MTWLLEEAQPVVDVVPTAARRSRRPVIVVAVLIVVIGIALWVLLPGLVAIGGTTVLLDAKPFTCRAATDVTTYDVSDASGSDEALLVPAVRLHPGLDCTMTVVVRNDSDEDVAVDSLTLPLAGPSNGIGIHADRAQTQGIAPSGGRDAIDAIFDSANDPDSGGAFPVRAHSVQRFDLQLSWSDGCMDDGSAEIFTDAPSMVLSAGPWHLQKSWNGAGYAFLGGKSTTSARC